MRAAQEFKLVIAMKRIAAFFFPKNLHYVMHCSLYAQRFSL